MRPLTDADARAFREAHADDLCECGHRRGLHYLPGGSTVGCSECRRCANYALDRTVVPDALF